jgi:hypothetical protein
MMSEVDAIIGSWYQAVGGQTFEVVAIDEGCIEIQYFEGEVEEIEADSWREMPLALIEPPEDWSGAYDNIENDDLGYSDLGVRPENGVDAVAIVEPEQ